MAKTKILTLWNGRGTYFENHDDPRWEGVSRAHVNIAAKSVADAIRLTESYLGCSAPGLRNEITTYFSRCWGNSMHGITPERGIWIEFERDKPIKVV